MEAYCIHEAPFLTAPPLTITIYDLSTNWLFVRGKLARNHAYRRMGGRPYWDVSCRDEIVHLYFNSSFSSTCFLLSVHDMLYNFDKLRSPRLPRFPAIIIDTPSLLFHSIPPIPVLLSVLISSSFHVLVLLYPYHSPK